VNFARSFPIVNHWGSGYAASSDLMSLDASKHLYTARVDPGLPLISVPEVPVGFLGNSSGRVDFS
jgi:hypothetical protein